MATFPRPERMLASLERNECCRQMATGDRELRVDKHSGRGEGSTSEKGQNN